MASPKVKPPEHRNPNPNRTAVAPYNFVPLPEAIVTVVSREELAAALARGETPKEKREALDKLLDERLPSHDRYAPGRHTGYFQVALETLTPLYIRGTLKLQEFLNQEQNKYADGKPLPDDRPPEFRRLVKNLPAFFYTRDPNEPVLPGSSLRGMLRNLFEIVTYSKLQPVTDKKYFYRSVDDSALGREYGRRMTGNVEAGILKQNGSGYFIQKCELLRVHRRQLDKGAWQEAVEGNKPLWNFYEGRAPNLTPRWNHSTPHQYQRVWVQRKADSPFVNEIRFEDPKEQDWEKGRLVLTGDMPTKKYEPRPNDPNPPKDGVIGKKREFVFVPNGETIPVEYDLIKRFRDDAQVTLWQERAFPSSRPKPKSRDGAGWLRRGELLEDDGNPDHGDPVFFLREKARDQDEKQARDAEEAREEGRSGGDRDNLTVTFFGRAGMFRLPYLNSPHELIPEALRRPEDIDMAEAVFGFVRNDLKQLNRFVEENGLKPLRQGDKLRAYAGRVFVTEAVLAPNQGADLWFAERKNAQDKPLLLEPKVLATPKPTTFQHYLTQREPNNKKELTHYDSQPAPTVRGHKLYWHQGERTAAQIQESDSQWLDPNGNVKANSKQHTQIQPVKPGVRFTFRVYFENLSTVELGALQWVLTLPGEAKVEYAHSLGMGKPLGMGAIKLTPTLHLTDRRSRYRSLLNGDQWDAGNEVMLKDDPLRVFERDLLQQLGASAARLYETPRLRTLLKMMEWRKDDPQTSKKRYMTLGEFRLRPVLPEPLAAVDGRSPDSSGQPVSRSTTAPARQPPQSKPRDAVSRLRVGQVFVGTIEQIADDQAAIINLPDADPARVYAVIEPQDSRGRRYAVGAQVRCRVLESGQDETGVQVYYCQPAD